MTRPPPRSTLFPYTTLFRSWDTFREAATATTTILIILIGGFLFARFLAFTRSEEHTSELQSQSNLVCRLLLEKKKNTYSLPFGMVKSNWPRSSEHKYDRQSQ